MKFQIELPGVKLGIVEADGGAVGPAGPALVKEVEEVCVRLRQDWTLESLAKSEAVTAIRALFRRWGVDPSRYRPSSEALLRRVVQGKGLYHISNIVDLNNVGSIETGWPLGTYNRAAIAPPVTLRLGTREEQYEGIGGRVWHLAGQPVLADSHGPFGSPISDSTRTQITEGVTEVLTVIYVPAAAPADKIEEALARLAKRLMEAAGARGTRVSVVC